jgi:signal transduction histidine kinase
MDWLGLLTIIAVAGLIFLDYVPEDSRRWWVLPVLGGLIWLVIYPWQPEQLLQNPLRYLLPTALIVVLYWLNASLTGLIVILFVLSAEVMALHPWRTGLFWIVVWGGLTTLFLGLATGDFPMSILHGSAVTSGYLFVGSAASAQQRAELAHGESQRLLAELQIAHRQLMDYAANAEEFALTQERNRLAREMHDTLGHRLTVAAVQLEGAQRLIAHNPDKAQQMVSTVHTQVVEGLAELRRTVAALRTPVEEELSLPSALTRLANHFQEATGITTHLSLPGKMPPLPPEHRHALFRMAQEALTNVQRHADAGAVWLQVDTTGDANVAGSRVNPAIRLTITDDGRGMPVERTHGYGLSGLDERARQLGGQFVIRTGSYGGVELVMSLPLPPSLPANEAGSSFSQSPQSLQSPQITVRE